MKSMPQTIVGKLSVGLAIAMPILFFGACLLAFLLGEVIVAH